MMGKKKLSTVREQILHAFDSAGQDPAKWIDQELKRLKRSAQANEGELKALLLLRDSLAEAAKARVK